MIEWIAVCISTPIVIYYGYQIFKDHKSRDQTRRFLKLMITGKYEQPEENKK